MNIVDVCLENGQARVTVSDPPVNATSTAVRKGLLDAVTKVQGCKRAILKCAGRTFTADGSSRATLGALETKSHGSWIRAARLK